MKKNVVIIVLVLICFTTYGQKFAKMDKSVMDAAFYPAKSAVRVFEKNDEKRLALEPKIRVLYSRPLKKGREVFGKLLKYDKPWRIGANESTEILFLTNVKFGDTNVKAGRYSLIAIPTATNWTIKLNTQNDGWGDYSYEPSKDIASVTVPTQTSNKEIEALSIALYEKSTNVVHLKIGWDKTYTETPITLK